MNVVPPTTRAVPRREPVDILLDWLGAVVLLAVQALGAFLAWLAIALGGALFPSGADLDRVSDITFFSAVASGLALLGTVIWAVIRSSNGKSASGAAAAGFAGQSVLWTVAVVLAHHAGVPFV